jgi:ABC-type nitrate/sulfonate/bicarbonate transport system permease component
LAAIEPELHSPWREREQAPPSPRGRGSARETLERLIGFGLVGLLLVAWQAASVTGAVSRFYFPSIDRIARSFMTLTLDGSLPHALAVSLGRGLAGYGLAIALGLSIGVLAGRHRFVYHLFEPTIELLRPIPSPAIIPIAILLLGIDSSMKVFIVAWACVFPVLLNTMDAVRAIPPPLIETARNLGLGYVRTIHSLVLPAAAPGIFTGLRIALAPMLILTVVTEMVAGNNGIGFVLLDAERSFRVADMYAVIVALAIVGYSLNRAFLAVDRRVLAWHHAMHRDVLR